MDMDSSVEDLENSILELITSKNNFTIRKITKKSDSDVWKHFGELVHISGETIKDKTYTDKIFCIHCFENAKEKNPKFKRCIVYSISKIPIRLRFAL